jgi:signal transduction histidine kinase
LASGALFLLASWLEGGGNWFLPNLLFMLTAQAFVTFSPWYALLYSSGVAAVWLGLVWTWSGEVEQVLQSGIGISAGMLFSALFALVIGGYSRQTLRAEALLRELQAANAALDAARDREKELAAAEERVRLAREIHDGLGHHLTVLNVQLQAAARLVELDPERAVATIRVCREEAQGALDEVRQSVAVMRSTPLDGRSLDGALRKLVRDFDAHSPLNARFELRGTEVALSPPAAMTLYRATQEALTNVQKHASAKHVTVSLELGMDAARLSVHDDGDARDHPGSGGGFGLAGLRERVEQLGGVFSAAPRPPGGFQLSVSLPLKGQTDDSLAPRR